MNWIMFDDFAIPFKVIEIEAHHKVWGYAEFDDKDKELMWREIDDVFDSEVAAYDSTVC